MALYDADNLPLPVVNFLNVIGVRWPYLNRAGLTGFADVLRRFAQALQQTHADITATMTGIGNAYHGVAGRALNSGWAKLTTANVREIVDAAHLFAGALDGWAGYVEVRKAYALEQFIVLADSFIADQLAALETGGLSEIALPAIVLAGRAVGESLLVDLNQYVVGTVVDGAAKPFFARVDAAVAQLDWSKSGAPAPSGSGLIVELSELHALAATMSAQARTWSTHAVAAQRGLAGLVFT